MWEAVLGWVVACTCLLWLPGYAWVRVLMPDAPRAERAVLSVALSVAFVILALVLGDLLFAIPITPVHALWASLGIALLSLTAPLGDLLYARLSGALR